MIHTARQPPKANTLPFSEGVNGRLKLQGGTQKIPCRRDQKQRVNSLRSMTERPSLPDRSLPHVTELLLAWGQGDRGALDELVPIVHQELRRLAKAHMRGERNDHTLQTTALVNEAFIRLVDLRRIRWQDRAHFLALSARLMRRILVDHARSHNYQKRGGGAVAVTLDDMVLPSTERGADLVALDDALEHLARVDPRKGQVVELRFFGGLSVEETAEALNISAETVFRDWRLAKVWLLREVSGRG